MARLLVPTTTMQPQGWHTRSLTRESPPVGRAEVSGGRPVRAALAATTWPSAFTTWRRPTFSCGGMEPVKRVRSMIVVMRRLALSACSTRSARARTGYIIEIAVTPPMMRIPNATTVAIVTLALMERPCTIRPTVPRRVQTAGQIRV
ncbi:hypothetical protein GCM10009850_004010 [Nonomuraea monospora]|uniref:Uncharacterized protein n=1 Tax=Nonomuraea monospora TaxID=568818 RepID=A0ABN3C680_9ACTN